jgi:hypothetical protein
MRPTSVPHLLAMTHGERCTGMYRCFFCGAPALERWAAADFVRESFTGRAGVVAPGSPWICNGCVFALRESCDVTMITGEIRHVPKAAMRAFSWVITKNIAYAASKANRDLLANICMRPPKPPYAIVLSDSGKTHLLYRGVVNHDNGPVTLTLETELITYHPDALAALLDVAGQIVAAAGKPTLSIHPLPLLDAVKAMERRKDCERAVDIWSHLGDSPIGHLAAWLTPKKKVCADVYPADVDRRPAAQARGPF